MRLSSSLQDLPTFSRIETLERGSSIGGDLSSGRAKPVRTLQREGPVASFSKERTPPSSPTNRKKWMRTVGWAVGLILLVCFIYASLRYFHVFLSEGSSEYYVILDCGSTGTRVYVYEWSINHNDGNSFPIALKPLGNAPKKKSGKLIGRAYQRMETEPGLSKLVHNETGMKKAIEPLLQMAERQIPRRAHKHTPVFLYATAGVRKLPTADSEWLMDKAWDVLKNSSFSCSRDRVKIISGMEEAYYGWVALNHHLNMLGTSSSASEMTYGSLDLGGSSLQVTFETDKAVQGDTGVGLTIGSVNHQLSAYSLSGYGLNDAFDKSVAHLVKMLGGTAGNGKVQVKHPCLQTGYREDYVCSYCQPLKQDGSPSVSAKTTGKEKQGTAVELIGAPQWKECSDLAKVTVNLSEWSNSSSGLDCNLQPCALASTFPQPHGQFYAMSGFYVVFKFFNLTPDATLVDVLKRGQEFCEKPWDVARSSVPPQPFIEQYCFRAPYITSLLREGLQIKDNQVIIGSGDGRTKTPLSPTVAGSEPHPFSMTHGLGGSSVQLMESSRQSLGVYHSYSVGSLGQMQFSSGLRNPTRGQTTLQSRRSQSREDLTSSLADLHIPKV
uniref:Ectonucleoside triphosphate diphosphohydrolase 8 n=1 Tax=Aegilops tauschii TaxID=37682 RepID=N1QR44_AEGTA